MGSSKRKRQSTDSAIADMSSEESFATDSGTQASSEQASDYNTFSQREEEGPLRKRRGSWGFDARGFGTAASQRPRRGASRMPKAGDVPQSLPRKSELEAVKDVSPGTSQTSSDEVNGNNEKRSQTPQRKQASIAFPTPPQTAEKTHTQSPLQPSLRRSTSERRPTERSEQASIEQDSPCSKKVRVSTISTTSDRSEEISATESRKSCIVRLRVASSSTRPTSSQSMSFAGSFSHRQKSSDEQDSQVSQEQVSKNSNRSTITVLMRMDRM